MKHTSDVPVTAAAAPDGSVGPTSAAGWLVDAHVHLHDAFDPAHFLAAAAANIRRGAGSLGVTGTGALLLTEGAGHDAFDRLRAGGRSPLPAGWSVEPADEDVSAVLVRDGETCLVLVAGRQIATAERLEVLALGTTARFDDGATLRESLDRAHALGALPVIPWGFGKWWFHRRHLLERIVEEASSGSVYLGDHGGRPHVAPDPRLLARARARGIWNLPGTDPLPLSWQADRAGSYGFFLPCQPRLDAPWSQIRACIGAARAQPATFGRRETLARFARAQTAIRMAGSR